MDDLISRQAAIDTIQKYKVEHGYAYFDCASEIENDIKNLPSAQPDVPDRNVGDMISRQVALKEIEEWISALYENAHHESASDGKMILNAIKHLPSAQPEEQHGRVFKGIVVEYPSYNTYQEYIGKPYFSIKYTENGQEFIGYGTYKPEVLSEYLKEYFMPSAQPTLYGYNIEHLELIARVLRKENLPPERVAEALMDIGRIVAIVTDEVEETLRKSVEQSMDFAVGEERRTNAD